MLGVVPLCGGLLCSALCHCGEVYFARRCTTVAMLFRQSRRCAALLQTDSRPTVSLATDRQQTHSVPCYRQQTYSVPCYKQTADLQCPLLLTDSKPTVSLATDRQQTYSVPCYRQTADPQCPVSGWVHWARVAEGVQIRRLVITRHPMLVKSSLCRGQHEGVWMGRLSSYSEPHPPSTPPQQKQCGWNYRQTQRQPEDGETAATQSNSSCPEWTRHVNACAEDRPS